MVEGLGQFVFQDHSTTTYVEPNFTEIVKAQFGGYQVSLGTIDFLWVVTAFLWVNVYGCSRELIFPWRKPCAETQLSNKFPDPSSNTGCACSAAGERQTFQVNVMRKEEYRKSAEAVQNELSLLPWMLLLGRKGRGEEGERQREEEKTQRFESCGWQRNPTTVMDETKGKA